MSDKILLSKSTKKDNDRLFLKIGAGLIEIYYGTASSLEYQLKIALSNPELSMRAVTDE